MELDKKILNKYENLCKKYEVASDLLDIQALYDRKINESENFEQIEEMVKTLGSSSEFENKVKVEGTKKTIKHEKEKAERLELEQLKLEELNTKKEMENAIKDIANNDKSNLNVYFKPLKDYVSSVVKSKGTLNSLFVCSAGGLGKTTIVLSRLAEEKIDYVYINNYITSVEFVNFLYENKDKTIVLDDVETILKNLRESPDPFSLEW